MPTTYYNWDGLHLLQEYDQAGATIAQYITEPVNYGYVFGQRRNGHTQYLHYEGLGSTSEVTDAFGTIATSFRYSGFGETVEQAAELTCPFRFAGRVGYYHDHEWSAYYVRRRHYSPITARWASPDPLQFGDLLHNLYRYVDNRPLYLTDPSGNAAQFGLLGLLIATSCLCACIACVVNVTNWHGQAGTLPHDITTTLSCGGCAVCALGVCISFGQLVCLGVVVVAGVVFVFVSE